MDNSHDNSKNNIKMVWVNIEDEDFEQVKQLAIEIFDDKDRAELWLNTPLKLLNSQTPIMRLESSGGREEVTQLLRKIEAEGFP